MSTKDGFDNKDNAPAVAFGVVAKANSGKDGTDVSAGITAAADTLSRSGINTKQVIVTTRESLE